MLLLLLKAWLAVRALLCRKSSFGLSGRKMKLEPKLVYSVILAEY